MNEHDYRQIPKRSRAYSEAVRIAAEQAHREKVAAKREATGEEPPPDYTGQPLRTPLKLSRIN